MYREVEDTGDLNGTHGVGSTISSVVVQRGAQYELHAQSIFEDGKHVRLVVTLMQKGH
jgi:hypothetical protein